MKRKLIALALAAVMALCLLTGCETVGKIAGNVADAAMKELEAQVKAVLEEYKVDPIEMKATAGKLNNDSEPVQIFLAVLVRADNEALPRSCAETLGKLFADSGVMIQTGSEIKSPYLIHKDLSYGYTGFDNGDTYYTIYVYSTIDPAALLSSEETK